MNWKTGKYEELGTTKWTNPNGNPKDPKDGSGYYTQNSKFYDSYMTEMNKMWDDYYVMSPIERDADNYAKWEEMHTDVVWFDTAACWAGPFIGNVNSVVISPDASVNKQYAVDPLNNTAATPASDANPALNGFNDEGSTFGDFWGGWYTGANYATTSPSKDWDKETPAYNKLVAPKNAAAPYQRDWKMETR